VGPARTRRQGTTAVAFAWVAMGARRDRLISNRLRLQNITNISYGVGAEQPPALRQTKRGYVSRRSRAADWEPPDFFLIITDAPGADAYPIHGPRPFRAGCTAAEIAGEHDRSPMNFMLWSLESRPAPGPKQLHFTSRAADTVQADRGLLENQLCRLSATAWRPGTDAVVSLRRRPTILRMPCPPRYSPRNKKPREKAWVGK